jgi:hypothetical protein
VLVNVEPGLLQHCLGANAKRAFMVGQDHAGQGGGTSFGHEISPLESLDN